MQHEITRPIPLLDARGNLTEPGWARGPLPIYERAKVKAGAARLKEWDYYLVMGEGFALALTIADNSYMGVDSISLMDFNEGWHVTKTPIRPFPMGSTGLPESSCWGDAASTGRGYGIIFGNKAGRRTLSAHMERFKDGQTLDVQVVLTDPPEDAIVTCVPFDKPGCFYYNEKINCMRATGYVKLGERTYTFRPEDSFGTFDWGRGVWTYHNIWYWASASGLVGGVPFGFNLGYGFGDTRAASEDAVFYNGKLYKLDRVSWRIPQKGGRADYMAPWRFTARDSHFEMSFQPMLDRAALTSLGVLKSDQHQVFGKFNGRIILNDGRIIAVRNLMGFAERVENKW